MKTSALLPSAAASRRQRLCLAGASVFFSAGFILWAGCGSLPLPASRTAPGRVQMQDMKQAKQAGLSKSEMFAKLGKPDEWYSDLNVACYKLNELERSHVEIFLGVPVPDNEKEPGVEVAMVQFDARGAQLRQTRRRVHGYDLDVLLRSEAERWASRS